MAEGGCIDEVHPQSRAVLARYRRGRLLGRGGFARCYEVTNVVSGATYAAKIVEKKSLTKQSAQAKLLSEIKIHSSLHHKHIVRFEKFFEDERNVYILLELCSQQTLMELHRRKKTLTELETQYTMMQLISAVQYMHDNDVIHRDLKLGNILLTEDMRIKIGDFGLAAQLEFNGERKRTMCGTPNYIAPEILEGKSGHSFEVDIWSIGVILYTLLVGRPPFETADIKSTYNKIKNVNYTFPDSLQISVAARQLIRKILQSQPEHRPTPAELQADPFFATAPPSLIENPPYTLFPATHELFAVYRAKQLADPAYAEELSRSRRDPFRQLPRDAGTTLANHQPAALKARKDVGDDDKENFIYRRGTGSMPLAGTTMAAPAPWSPPVAPSSPRTAVHPGLLSPRLVAPPAYEALQLPSRAESHYPLHSPTLQQQVLSPHSPALPSYNHMWSAFPHEVMEAPLPAAAACFQAAQTEAQGTGDDDDEDERGNLTLMHQQIEQSFAHKKATQTPPSPMMEDAPASQQIYPTGVTASPQPREPVPAVWVTEYADFSAKYGLPYTLSWGHLGVHFNDATKMIWDIETDLVEYISRQRVPQGIQVAETRQCFPMGQFPEALMKKVTLIKYFRTYLAKAKGRRDGIEVVVCNENAPQSNCWTPGSPMVYVKRWLRTKHAIIFRLSNKSVQVAFFDKTEILLASEARIVCYTDSSGARSLYDLNNLGQPHAEVAKRLKYTKDILYQLINK